MRALSISVLALAACLAWSNCLSRELAVAETDLLSAEIVGLQASPDGEMAAVLLKVEDEVLPIVIGMVEAVAIERARQGLQSPRPLTHDLLGDVIASADLRMQRLVIDELTDEGSFLAALELQPTDGGAVRRVDSRPSDGMALAVRSGARIVVARQVVAKARAAEDESDPGLPSRPLSAPSIET